MTNLEMIQAGMDWMKERFPNATEQDRQGLRLLIKLAGVEARREALDEAAAMAQKAAKDISQLR